MSPHIRYHEGIDSVAVIGNFLPRQCGLATFTTDLVTAISEEAPNLDCWAVAMNDVIEGYRYPERVRFEVNQNILSDYRTAAEFLNINQVDLVSVQHEFGIFGGPAGRNILTLLDNLRMPIVTTLHTILRDPDPDYRHVMEKLIELSDRLVVMSGKASEFLRDIYSVPEEKISFIHHGIHDTPFIDPNYYKEQFGVAGKMVLLTFGLLSPNKGIETVLEALPAVLEGHPDVTYIVLGATHPHVLSTQGEEYRISLQQLARKLGISDHVIFQNRFVGLKELSEFLGTADIYITPFLSEAQITSGTLVYAMGAGKPVISTPYWYASDMLADGRGRIVPFGDHKALASQIIDLLDDDVARHATRKKAYDYCREAVWEQVAGKYLDLFDAVKLDRTRYPRPRNFSKVGKLFADSELPELNLHHLKEMTDDTGILQHANHTISNRFHGYCTDDNARALAVVAQGRELHAGSDSELEALNSCYLSFLGHAFDEDNGRFHNFMDYSRQWLEQVGSEDSHGRALWGLGKAVAYLENPGQLAVATTLFHRALKAAEKFDSPRAWSFALVGIHAYLQKFSGNSDVRRAREILANKLYRQFTERATGDWPWPEEKLTYANGKLPHALLLSGQWIQNGGMIEMGLGSLKWLIDLQTMDGHFVPIGNKGWYEISGDRARFDQQPIEANAMVEACISAFQITGDEAWIDDGLMCFNWFLGRNDLNLSLYDPKTGGCRDGLMADGVNQNEGAESTLACLLSLIALQDLSADVVLEKAEAPRVIMAKG